MQGQRVEEFSFASYQQCTTYLIKFEFRSIKTGSVCGSRSSAEADFQVQLINPLQKVHYAKPQ